MKKLLSIALLFFISVQAFGQEIETDQIANRVAKGKSVITSTAPIAFAVGQNGVLNPAFYVNSSKIKAITGVEIIANTGGGYTTIQELDPSYNTSSGLQFLAAGNGNIALGATYGSVVGNIVVSGSGQVTIAPAAISYQSVPEIIIGPNGFGNTQNLTASANVPFLAFGLNGPFLRGHQTGALALQTDYEFLGYTDYFAAASTLTTGATVSVNYKLCGTNATCTNEAAFYTPATAITGTVTNSYGLYINAATGATHNYAAYFATGNVGIGSASPAATLDVNGPVKTGGSTVALLPTGSMGDRYYVTDQTTACVAAGAALTGGGNVVCPVFFNGTSWVGD